jgi:FkbM family methyltransferase
LFRKRLASKKFLRKPLFALATRFLDVPYVLNHDLTGRRLFINLWRHKGYWFYGKSRERHEIAFFRQLIKPGYCVVEVGAHIGYLSQLFEELVGPKGGGVIVCEPTLSSLHFLRRNVLPETFVLPVAISDRNGYSSFFCEAKGGFTNSLSKDWTLRHQQGQVELDGGSLQELEEFQVKVLKLDDVCFGLHVEPDFLKIDVEGAELDVLKGSVNVLKSVSALMVEASGSMRPKVIDFLGAHGLAHVSSCGSNHFFARSAC